MYVTPSGQMTRGHFESNTKLRAGWEYQAFLFTDPSLLTYLRARKSRSKSFQSLQISNRLETKEENIRWKRRRFPKNNFENSHQ